MNNIQGFTGAKVDWGSLVGKIKNMQTAEVSKAGPGALFADGVKVSVGEGGFASRIAPSVPNLEAPAVAASVDLDAVAQTLSTAAAQIGSTPEEVAAAEAAMSQVAQAAQNTPSTKSVFFDLYALMALMLEAAQAQRDAARDIRQAESATIQASIQNQAEQQRSAAIAGAIVGAVVGVIQIGIQAVSIGFSIKGMKDQYASVKEASTQKAAYKEAAVLEKTETAKLTDLQDIKSTLTKVNSAPDENAKAALTSELDTKINAYNNKYDLSGDGAVPKSTTENFGTKLDSMIDGQSKIAGSARDNATAQKLELANAIKELEIDTKGIKAADMIQISRMASDMAGSIGSAIQSIGRGIVDSAVAEATAKGAVQKQAEEELDQSKDLFDQAKDVINAVMQLLQAISQAEGQSMRDAIQA